MNIQKIYAYALQREYEGKRFFEDNASRLSHATAIQAFKTLAGEEQKHIEFISSQLEALQHGQAADLVAGEEIERAGFFAERATTEMLDQTVAEAMVPDLPILRMAYLIERDFAEFYETMAGKLDGAPRQVLLMLANWERAHERLFRYLHDQAFEKYSEMPWGG